MRKDFQDAAHAASFLLYLGKKVEEIDPTRQFQRSYEREIGPKRSWVSGISHFRALYMASEQPNIHTEGIVMKRSNTQKRTTSLGVRLLSLLLAACMVAGLGWTAAGTAYAVDEPTSEVTEPADNQQEQETGSEAGNKQEDPSSDTESSNRQEDPTDVSSTDTTDLRGGI
jgi:hypothetical protein